MILVGQYDSPFVRRVAVTLEQYDLPFTRDPKSIFRDAPALGAINPLVRVPALILDTGEILIDSAALIAYLDELVGPSRALTPPKGPERRTVLRALALSTGISEKVVVRYFEQYFHEPETRSHEWEALTSAQITGALSLLEKECGAPWFLGAQFSQADITIACMLGHLASRFPDLLPDRAYPRLQNLSLACEATESFIRTRPSDEETVPSLA